jgi:mono/diheme cytochrome c family protein
MTTEAGHWRKSAKMAALVSAALALGLALGMMSRKAEPPPGSIPARPGSSWLGVLGRLLLAYAGLAIVAVVVAAIVVLTGAYNVAATSQHSNWTFSIIHYVAKRSIRERAAALKPPSLGPHDLDRGLTLFDQQCVRCHGAPGQAREAFAEGMNPLPPPLVQPGREWTMQQIYWTTAQGVHMTGMPAFMFRMSDKDIWAVAAWVKQMATLTPDQYEARREAAKALASADASPPPAAAATMRAPDPKRGRLALAQHGCVGCHVIPGLSASQESQVGPSLAGIGRRAFIAGTLENNSVNLAAFIVNPKAVRPHGAMPQMRVDPRDAADIVAYLRTLRTP